MEAGRAAHTYSFPKELSDRPRVTSPKHPQANDPTAGTPSMLAKLMLVPCLLSLPPIIEPKLTGAGRKVKRRAGERKGGGGRES